MGLIDLVGAAAGVLTTVAFVPQVMKTWRTRSADDISLYMFLLFSIGVGLWLVYGLALNAWPIIVANAVTLCLASSVLMLKLRYSRRRRLDREASGRLGM